MISTQFRFVKAAGYFVYGVDFESRDVEEHRTRAVVYYTISQALCDAGGTCDLSSLFNGFTAHATQLVGAFTLQSWVVTLDRSSPACNELTL